MKNHFLISLISIISFFIPSDEKIKVTWTNFQGEEIEDIYGIGSKIYFYEAQKLVKLEFRNKRGELIPERKLTSFYPAEFRYTYDSHGNYISREAYNQSGELMNLDGYYDSAILKFKYNAQNQLVERQTLDKDGRLLEMGDSKIAVKKYDYDKSGHLISVTNYDGTGNVLPDIVKYSYRPDGKLDKSTYLNLSNEVITEIDMDYNEQGLLSGYMQVYPENNDVYTLQFSYVDSIFTALNVHLNKSGNVRAEKRGVKIGLAGWFMEDSLLLNSRFQYYGEGEFQLTIEHDGKIKDLEPIELKAPIEFEQEVYELFRNLELKREEQIANPDSVGKVVVSILEPFPTLESLKFVKKPKPND
ncbi:MAG: hypothetical protein KDC84_15295 [Crocinitomicaceae bacterium]|nr:hypothetical protein [Crocinitomicaceae bacterium]